MKSKAQLRQDVKNVRTASSDVVLRQRLQTALDGIIDALGRAEGGNTYYIPVGGGGGGSSSGVTIEMLNEILIAYLKKTEFSASLDEILKKYVTLAYLAETLQNYVSKEELAKILEDLVKMIFEEADQRYLSKKKDDEAAGRITFDKGWLSKDAIDSFLAGSGTLLSKEGNRIQTDVLEVRQSMKVMELIINRLRAMSSDFLFDETRKVEKVELVGYEQGHDGTAEGDELYGIYKLTLNRDTEFDFHAFHEGDIVYQIVNTIPLGGSDYHTGHYHVTSVDTKDNSITVFLYHEDDLNGATNYVPMADFNIAHRGNVNGADLERLSQWLLSSSEGRITFLDNLTQPTIHQRNYAAYIGKFLDTLDYGRNLPIRKTDTVVFARHLLAENLYMVDFNGEVITQQPERGAWSYEVAISDRPYRCVYTDEVEHVQDLPDKKHTLLTQDKVTHLGSTWICLKDKTTQEPWVDSAHWQCVNGNNTVAIEIHSSAGQMFRNGDVETELYAVLYYNGIDITEKVLGMALRSLSWTRDTGIEADDAAWNDAHETTRNGLGVRIIQNSERFDLGTRFFSERRPARFTFSVELPVNDSDGSVRYSETVTVK